MSPRTFDSLAGKLAPRPPARPVDQPATSATTRTIRGTGTGTAPANEHVPEQVSSTRPNVTSARQTMKSKTGKIEAGGATRQVAFLMPPALRDRLRERARGTDRSQPNVVLDAIEASYPHLADLIAETAVAGDTSGLFIRTAPRDKKLDAVTVSIRLTVDAVTTIDNLVAKLGADSRTHLLNAALNHYLRPAASTR